MNAEAARGVRGRLNHAPLIPAAAHHQQLDVAQLGVIMTGDLHEEGIEVHVKEAGRHAGLDEEDGGGLERKHNVPSNRKPHVVR